LDAGDVETITFTPGASTAAQVASQINTQLDLGSPLATVATKGAENYVLLDYATLLRIRPTGTANAILGFSITEYTKNDLQGGHGGMRATNQPTAFVTWEGVTALLSRAASGGAANGRPAPAATPRGQG
jgi:hypothetical protein